MVVKEVNDEIEGHHRRQPRYRELLVPIHMLNKMPSLSFPIPAQTTVPTSGASNLPPSIDCNDPNPHLTSLVKLSVPSQTTIPASSDLDVGFAVVQDQSGQSLIQWILNSTAIAIEWDKPT
jgi:hypothetical protein